MVKMIQKILNILFVVGIIYIWIFHPLWLIISFAVIALVLVILLIWGLMELNKWEKGIKTHLDECDEKLKNGEMTKEENEQIHFYWECQNFGY